LTVGVRPNVGFLEGSGIEIDRGVLIDEHLRTSVADVYAVGDCVQLRHPAPGRRATEPVWYTARTMGQCVARTVCGESTPYEQGIWFNSAKFFDLEWQVYGAAPAELPPDQETIYWEHASGQKSIRINYRTLDGAVTGFNLMGIRYRHELCEAWIRDARPVRWVLENLGAANFDPELFPEHEAQVVEAFNRRHPDVPVRLRRRRGLAGRFRLSTAS
jgi:NAD(P)H-nitrite reductase large subunit